MGVTMTTVTLADLIASMGTDKRYDVFVFGKPFLLFAKIPVQDERVLARDRRIFVWGKEHSTGKYYQWQFSYEVIEDGCYEFRASTPPPLW